VTELIGLILWTVLSLAVAIILIRDFRASKGFGTISADYEGGGNVIAFLLFGTLLLYCVYKLIKLFL